MQRLLASTSPMQCGRLLPARPSPRGHAPNKGDCSDEQSPSLRLSHHTEPRQVSPALSHQCPRLVYLCSRPRWRPPFAVAGCRSDSWFRLVSTMLHRRGLPNLRRLPALLNLTAFHCGTSPRQWMPRFELGTLGLSPCVSHHAAPTRVRSVDIEFAASDGQHSREVGDSLPHSRALSRIMLGRLCLRHSTYAGVGLEPTTLRQGR